MLYLGSKLDTPVPTDISIWSWLFDQALPTSKFNRDQTAGFRDAKSQEFLPFAEVKSLATYLSTAIAQRYDIKTGSHVTIFCSNSIWYPVVTFSTVRLGAIVTGSSPEYGLEEMMYILKASESDLVCADSESWDVVWKAAEKVGLGKSKVVFIGSASGVRAHQDKVTIQDLIREGKEKGKNGQVKSWEPANGQSNAEVPAYLSFTSGTTSLPKGVMISHHNVIAQIMQMRSLTAADCPKVMLGVLPLYHITGIVQILQLPLALNQEVVMMAKFNMQEMLDVIVKYKCDELWLVPPLLIRLVNDPVAAGYDLRFVKQFNTGAAPLAKEIIDKLAKRFSHIRIRQAWGMTESTSALTLTPPSDQTYDKAHTVGKVVPETVIKIIDPEYEGEGERILGVGESGEVLAKGPQVTMGYYNRPDATAETYDQDGFLHTGDIGFMDQNGFLMIHDRLKEMIKVKGVGVAPAELEDLLLGHPLVADAAVIGIPDDYAGEVPKAFVVLVDPSKSGAETSKELLEFVKQKKSRPKWLAGGIEFVEMVPKSASGKVLRRVLRDQEKQRTKQNKGKL
ncbi:uncharacterized protein Z518_11012 [Rhinocladiella mackenziei CBS 650.93]|uniref:4-coumarate-CoA ligase n=1 Tax=Rhinocladiella mackenziei CBS 650.93 TaxID=1442369 RepID=A0A0D2IS88_9EURO|nr:uncharacterized protein Z518_11012 [Rhinocladiella mackenziei CBS 650.93]KIW99599.1 hypothetical protein Z518_11012 [Rhinocladiella mackenziei CBS 650.93]